VKGWIADMHRPTIAIVISNRDFFPDVLVTEARRDLLQLFAEAGINPILLGEQETKLGALETWQDAVRCAELFRKHRDSIDGVLISLPNFGDEKAVADALRGSGLQVPILVQAYPDDLNQFGLERRRDAFCGKISVCNNLRQYGIPFSLTEAHTLRPSSPEFLQDLQRFLASCRVVRGLRGARIGAVGARPNAFNTTRYSEKLLEASGISVNTIDLSEVFGRIAKIADDDPRVKQKLEEIHAYADDSRAPGESLMRMAKFAIVLLEWMNDLSLNATAIQCWSSMQQNFHVNVCTIMSMMSEKFMPSACEVDIAGVVSMYALQLASGRPSALVDWNNNYGDDPDKCVLFHCGNWAKDFLPDIRIETAPILGTVLGEENTFGALTGRTAAGPLTFARVSTDDLNGKIRAFVGEGQFTDDPLKTFGTKAVAQIKDLSTLMRFICKNGFEHHAAITTAHVSASFHQALSTYIGWEVYQHSGR
jgi:L-fucose isomerase-like protein